MSRITCRGASGVPMAVAGQTSVQRPHSVHEKASSTCFQLTSAKEAIPTKPSGGPSSAAIGAGGTCVIASGRSAPRGGSLPKNTFGIAVMMWKCFESGSTHRNTRTVTQCSHHPTSLTVLAVERLRPPSAVATIAASGAKSRSLPWMSSATRRPASYSSPPTMINRMKTSIKTPSQ